MNEIQPLLTKLQELKKEIRKVIIGQEEVIDQLLVTFIAGGHTLLEGVPGLAKTLMVSVLAQATDLEFKRIQFTPDLMPTDIIGTEILQENPNGQRQFRFNKGPIFANIVLADEINRTPPKTQAALLEAMQERSVSYAGTTYPLDTPFFILATQNPIEQAGTFPLPEAQTDRFMLFVKINYPSENEEKNILKSTTTNMTQKINPVISASEIKQLQTLVRDVHLNDDTLDWITRLIRNTRPQTTDIEEIKMNVQWGAGPRAGQSIILAAKAFALLNGRFAVTHDDVRTMTYPTLRHRILLNFKAEAERITTDDMIDIIVTQTFLSGENI
mgnify:FL=1